MPNSIVQKRCSCCKKTKEPDEFNRNKSHKDGRHSQCRDCERTSGLRYYRSAKGNAVRTAYAKTEKCKASHERHAEKYPEKRRARNAVNNAVVAGHMPSAKTQTCQHCDNQAELYHHHKGYATEHWLDVIALCRKCDVADHLTISLRLGQPQQQLPCRCPCRQESAPGPVPEQRPAGQSLVSVGRMAE